MKTSILWLSVLLLVSSMASAQVVDLPLPDDMGSGEPQQEEPQQQQGEAQPLPKEEEPTNNRPQQPQQQEPQTQQQPQTPPVQPTVPVTPPAPPKGPRCAQDICIGDEVINTERSDLNAVVTSISVSGTYTLKFLAGELKGQSGEGWSRAALAVKKGCVSDNSICMGTKLLVPSRKNSSATVVGMMLNDRFVLKFASGDHSGQIGSGWAKKDIALTKGCTADKTLCVGMRGYNINRDYAQVEIMAVQEGNMAVLKWLDGQYKGQLGENWERQDLAISQGCVGNGKICVGKQYINRQVENATVTVLGFQHNGRILVQYANGTYKGQKGHNWEVSDLKAK